MSGQQAVTALTITAAVVFGVVLALLGSVKLALARRPEPVVRPVETLLTVLNLALVPVLGVAGLLVDFWGARPLLIFGPIVLAGAFLTLSAGPSYVRSVLAVLAAALGAACLGLATLAVMPRGLFGPAFSAGSLQLGLVFVALGALLAPPLADLLARSVGFRLSMAVLALLVLSPAFLAALPDNESLPSGGTAAGLAALGRLLADTSLWTAALVFFFYAPLEGFVGVWAVTFLSNVGQARRQTAWLAGFWAAFLLSRLLFAFVIYWGELGGRHVGWFLLFPPALLCAVVLGNMCSTTRFQRAFPGLLLLGFFMGPIFPVLLGILFWAQRVDGVDLPGTSLAVLHSAGSVGSLALAPLVKLSLGARSVQVALLIPMFVGLAMSAAALVFVLVS